MVSPSAQELIELRQRIAKRFPAQSGFECVQARERRISKVFAHELRRRGWLHEEGYAPGSWAAP